MLPRIRGLGAVIIGLALDGGNVCSGGRLVVFWGWVIARAVSFYGDQLVVVESIGLAMSEDGLVCGVVGAVRQRGVGLVFDQVRQKARAAVILSLGGVEGGHALLGWLEDGGMGGFMAGLRGWLSAQVVVRPVGAVFVLDVLVAAVGRSVFGGNGT